MNDNDKKNAAGRHETMAGTVGGHVNDGHDHPGGETPAGAKIDATATRLSGATGEEGALAGGPAPGNGRASGGPGSEADEATQVVADVEAHTGTSRDTERMADTAAKVGDRDRS